MKLKSILAAVGAVAIGFSAHADTWFTTDIGNYTKAQWEGEATTPEMLSWGETRPNAAVEGEAPNAYLALTNAPGQLSYGADGVDLAEKQATITTSIKFTAYDEDDLPTIISDAKAGVIAAVATDGSETNYYVIAKDGTPATNAWVKADGHDYVYPDLTQAVEVGVMVKGHTAIYTIGGKSLSKDIVYTGTTLTGVSYQGLGEVHALSGIQEDLGGVLTLNLSDLTAKHIASFAITQNGAELACETNSGVVTCNIEFYKAIDVVFNAAEGYVFGDSDTTFTKSYSNPESDITISASDLTEGKEGVASIEDTLYSSVLAALNAAEDGEKVSLVKDVVVSGNQIITNANNVTLDLNGKTISRTTKGYVMQLRKINLEITDSSEGETGLIEKSAFATMIEVGGDNEDEIAGLTLTSGSIVFNGDNGADNAGDCIKVNNGTFDMYGGTINTSSKTNQWVFRSYANCTVAVYGGTIIGPMRVVDDGAIVIPALVEDDLNPAKFKLEKEFVYGSYVVTEANQLAFANSCIDDDGYALQKGEDGYYTVREKTGPTLYKLTVPALGDNLEVVVSTNGETVATAAGDYEIEEGTEVAVTWTATGDYYLAKDSKTKTDEPFEMAEDTELTAPALMLKYYAELYLNGTKTGWGTSLGTDGGFYTKGTEVPVSESGLRTIESKTYYVSKLALNGGDSREFSYDGEAITAGAGELDVTISDNTILSYTVTTGDKACFGEVWLTEYVKTTPAITLDPAGPTAYTSGLEFPAVTVKDGETTLTEVTDYTVAWDAESITEPDAGATNTYTVTVTLTGKYIGSNTAEYKVFKENAGPTPVQPGEPTVVSAGDAEEAKAKVQVSRPAGVGDSVVTAAAYDGYFTKTAVETTPGSGQYTVTATLDAEKIELSDSVEGVSTQLSELATGTEGATISAKPGLYYSIEGSNSGLTGDDFVEGDRTLATETEVKVDRPAEKTFTDKGFFKVLVNTQPKAE